MNTRMRISNHLSIALTVWVEPWGRDYTMLNGETFELVMERASTDAFFNVFFGEAKLDVYEEGDCLDVLVYQEDRLLRVGHNRPGG